MPFRTGIFGGFYSQKNIKSSGAALKTTKLNIYILRRKQSHKVLLFHFLNGAHTTKHQSVSVKKVALRMIEIQKEQQQGTDEIQQHTKLLIIKQLSII